MSAVGFAMSGRFRSLLDVMHSLLLGKECPASSKDFRHLSGNSVGSGLLKGFSSGRCWDVGHRADKEDVHRELGVLS